LLARTSSSRQRGERRRKRQQQQQRHRPCTKAGQWVGQEQQQQR
jgi:hypothetical protein